MKKICKLSAAACAVLLAVAALCGCSRNRVVEISADPSIRDYTPVVREILEKHPRGHVTLKFHPGTFDFYPEEAFGKYLSVSNNDNGMKTVIFNLESMKNVSVEGAASDFVFHGAVIPFAVTGCRNVRFTFLGYDWEARLGENIVFDPRTLRPYYNTAEYQHWPLHQFTASEVEKGLVTFGNVWSKELPPVGSVWVDKGVHPGDTYCSAIVLTDSRDIVVENVRIYHSGAMSLIAQYCRDITVRNYSTARREGSSRMVTASADATHFVDCTGDILIEDCRFESMLDDAVNIHGTYMQMKRILSDREFAASFGHRQQKGNRFADKGDVIRIIEKATMRPVGTGRVRSIDRVNENWYIFSTDFPVGTLDDPERYAVENISRGASAVIRNCTVRYNRARSLLLSTPGDVLVENCSFASMMAGIVVCGDANYWYESGGCGDIIIRNNRFKDLGIGGNSPQAVLQIDPMIGSDSRSDDFFYHRNISFENNIVETFDSQIIYALSVADLSIRNNVFIDSGTWPALFGDLSAIDVQYCGNVVLEGNDFSGWKKDATLSIHDCVNADVGDCSLEVVDRPNPYFYGN